MEHLLWLLFLAPICIGIQLDRTSWNGGICKQNGESWEYFDTDSQGGRGYKARNYHTWISWPVDKRSKNE